jgi:ectoine hydroxylase-related dioxygenase (phytanoyl-CoA dioxygenase family)
MSPIRTEIGSAADDLVEFGCSRVTGLLTTQELAALRAAVEELAAEDRANSSGYVYSGTNQRVWALPNRRDCFLHLAEHARVITVLSAILGPDLILSNLSANIVGDGGGPMVAHWDQDWADRPWPHALVAHAIWMLDDFTEDNGATLVWPRSHLSSGPPGPGETPVRAIGPAGTCMFVDGRTWHGVSPNTTHHPRRALLAYYCRPYIRQQENFALSMPPNRLRTLTPSQRRLLGFEFYEYLNMVNGPPTTLDRY